MVAETEEAMSAMERLVVHPKDPSTDFLKAVYEGRDDVTVVTGGCSKNEVKEMVKDCDQLILMGHGTGWGLMSVGQFKDAPGNIVDDSFGSLLRKKDNAIFIWCHASSFVRHHWLKGFSTGMFISEPSEAFWMGVRPYCEDEIEESNRVFASAVGRALDKEPRQMLFSVMEDYGKLAKRSPVAAYNAERLFVSPETAHDH